jgi:hypothetical protein
LAATVPDPDPVLSAEFVTLGEVLARRLMPNAAVPAPGNAVGVEPTAPIVSLEEVKLAAKYVML